MNRAAMLESECGGRESTGVKYMDWQDGEQDEKEVYNYHKISDYHDLRDPDSYDDLIETQRVHIFER